MQRAYEADFSGQFENSQLIVGEHNVVHRYEGTVVQQLAPGDVPAPEPRGRPQTRLPKPSIPPLGRDGDLEMADQLLADGVSVEFYGPPGIGKSSMLGALARRAGESWADGVVHNNVGGKPLEDVVQWLFEVFWETKQPWAPGRLRVGEYLRDVQALVILDDLAFSADDTSALLETLDHSTFLIAGTDPHLEAAADGTVPLHGLGSPAGVSAFERGLRRSLEQNEGASVGELVSRVEGVPALVLDSARLVRDGVCGLSDLLSQPATELERRRVIALSDAQRRMLSLLVEVAPAAAPVELLHDALGVSGAEAQALEDAGFAESRSPRFALARPLSSIAGEQLPRLEAGPVLQVIGDVARREALSDDWAPVASAALEWGRRTGELDAVVETARAVDGMLLRALRTGAWGRVLESGLAAAHDRGRRSDKAYFLHQIGTRWLLLGERERASEFLRRALAMRKQLGEKPGVGATLANLGVLGARRRRWPAGAAAASGAMLGAASHGRVGHLTIGALGLAAGLALGLLVGGGPGNSKLAATQARKIGALAPRTVVVGAGTVTGPRRTVTRSARTVTQPGQTVPQPATAASVTPASSTITVTAPGAAVTRAVGTTATTTAPAVTSTVTHTMTDTVTHAVTDTVTHLVTTFVPTTVCIDCKP